MQIKLKSGLILNNPGEMLKAKFSQWPWKSYDGDHPLDPNSITTEDIHRVYKLGSRTREEAYKALLSKYGNEINAILKDIPNSPLEDIELAIIQDDLSKMFNLILNNKYIKLAGATKLLHPFRPSLIPVLDSVVARYYWYAISLSNEARFRLLKSHSEWGNYILELMSLIKEDVMPIRSQIDQLLLEAKDEPYHKVSRIRVVESLIWFYYARGVSAK
jgi:hypothetical protein